MVFQINLTNLQSNFIVEQIFWKHTQFSLLTFWQMLWFFFRNYLV